MKWFPRRAKKIQHHVTKVATVEVDPNPNDDRRKFDTTITCACGDTILVRGYEHADNPESYARCAHRFHQQKEALRG